MGYIWNVDSWKPSVFSQFAKATISSASVPNWSLAVRKLLVLDSSYAFEAIRERQLEDSVTCRDLDGFFEHVWTVHPFATLVTSDERTGKFGLPEVHTLAPAHTFIDGKIGRFAFLRRLGALNFLISQVSLFGSLVQLIRSERINALRVGNPLYLGLFGWALSRLCRIPLVIRVGSNNDKIYETTGRPMQRRLFFSRRVEKVVERFVLSQADLVAGANQDNLNFALANGAHPESSTLFRYGNLIDRRHFAAPADRADGRPELEKLGVKQGRFLLYVGRLESVKRPDDVVQVLAEIRRRGHDVKAVLVGDGQLLATLIELASKLGLEEQVVFCGNKDQRWLAQTIPLAAVVLSPHTGRALSEAALGEVPIVAYDVDWQSELICSGVTGELVPDRAVVEMANAVEHFLVDQVYARAMANAVRQRALQMLDPAALNQHEREQYSVLWERFERKQQRLSKKKSDPSFR